MEVYGSYATGLCLHWSDIDLAVGPRGGENEKDSLCLQESKIKDALRRVADSLKSEMANGWVTHVNYIEQATVPVVKV